ncbi:hypothetical protein PVAP13_6NG191600 [Panicum virgatum]|uniref:holo-[acyl-carrier-protein] synthase n=1 Tax=Panicum virgatum TaxID=38727 RepID=A0A8T0QX54_PANVG|nr:hypothetical protein PVAP13_6NG191600 [Panicum virgatum]
MRHRLLRRAMPLPPPTPPAPRTPGIAGGRLFSSLPPPPPPLQSRREVHVWYLLPDELNDASQLKMYMDLLSPSERKNALSMNTEKLQKGAVLSRALVRTTLSRYCKVDPGSFEFKKNKFGKPEILWQSDDNKMEWPLHFNISHTSSLIACGITMDNLIGIDIEEKKRKTAKNILSLARRYFTPSEVDYLAQIPDPDAQQKEFIKLWTLKLLEGDFQVLLSISSQSKWKQRTESEFLWHQKYSRILTLLVTVCPRIGNLHLRS